MSNFSYGIVIGFTFLCLSSCAVSDASNATQTNDNRPKVVQRDIDWSAAQKLADRHSNVVLAQTKLRSVRKNSTATPQLAVPLLLLPASFSQSANQLAAFTFADPLLLQTNVGYTVVYKSAQVDIVIDASNTTMQTAGNREIIEQEFDGQYQLMEGGGGEKTIGRFGALYSVQLMCNKPSTPQCVTETMMNEVIDVLDVYPVSVLSQ